MRKRIPFLVAVAILSILVAIAIVQRRNIEQNDLSRIGPDAGQKEKIRQDAIRESQSNHEAFERWEKSLSKEQRR